MKTLALGALAAPFAGTALAKALETFGELPVYDLATTEDFWEKVRADYKLKPDYINLESGYYNIIPTPTLDKLKEHIEMVNYEGSYYMRTVQWDNKKRMVDKLAAVVGCKSKNLIITRNTTESLDMVIKGMDWQPGDEAVYADMDYGAMINMLEQVSDRFGTVNKMVEIPDHPKTDEEIVKIYADAITPKTKLLMVCHMINLTGQILPVKKICQMAHEKGVQVMVDGAHCIGHFKFRIEDLGCDYYGSSLHKWLAVPLGTGLLYVKDEHIDTLWPLLAEAEVPAGDIRRLNHTGTIPVYHDLSIANAIEYYNILGAERKEARLRYLQQYWTSKVRDLENITINTPSETERACAIASVSIHGIKPAVVAKRLLEEYKIWTVAYERNSKIQGCRITPNVFTTTAELDVFVAALQEMAF